MKKWMIGVLGAIGVFCFGMGVLLIGKTAMAFSIIGGGDGPTSVFLAGKKRDVPLAFLGGGVSILAFTVWNFFKRRDKKERKARRGEKR